MDEDLIEPEVPPPSDPLAVNPTRPSDVHCDRPGFHVSPPAAEDEEWRHHAYQSMQIETMLVQVRYLFHVAYRPYNDPAYPRLKGMMMAFRPGLQQRAASGDVMATYQLNEMERFLFPARHLQR